MNLLNSPEFKVGALVVVISSLIGVMSLKVAEGPGLFGGGNHYYFITDNAGGLVKDSGVKMAGIKVGVIEDIKLKKGRAKVILRLDPGVTLRKTARVELQPDGILGDKHVELIRGQKGDPKLPSGSRIRHVVEVAGLDKLMSDISRITNSLEGLSDTLRGALQEGDPETAIGRVIRNIEKTSKDLADLTGKNKNKINNIIDRADGLMRNLDRYVNENSLGRLEQALANLEKITEDVKQGKGTLGKLVTDDKTVEELNTAIENVNKFLGEAQQLKTSIDFHSEYLASNDLTKSYLGVKIEPGLDRYYEIQAVDDPRGVERSTVTERNPNSGSASTVETTKVYRDRIKLTALFAKNFYDFTVKGGIIENHGGVGLDYHLLNRRLRLSVESFDFNDPYLRAFARYNFFKGIYVVGGGDNMLSATQSSGFLGAGIFLTNDDLKMLASQVSF